VFGNRGKLAMSQYNCYSTGPCNWRSGVESPKRQLRLRYAGQ